MVTFTKMNTFTVYQFLHFLTDVLYVVSCSLKYGVGELLVFCWENPMTAVAAVTSCVVVFCALLVRLCMWFVAWVKNFLHEEVFKYMVKLVAQNVQNEQMKPKKK